MVASDVSVNVNVVFFGGTELDPPPPLGTTGRTRYVKLNQGVVPPEIQAGVGSATLVGI